MEKQSFIYRHKNGISLRKIESSDLPRLKELKDESWFGTHSIAFTNMFTQQKWFEKISTDPNNLVLIAYNDVSPVGLYKISNIDWINRSYDSAHDIFKESRGQKLSKPVLEAGVDFGFEVLNMNRIDTEVLENNIASMKSAHYVGFQTEGIRRNAVWKVNNYYDSVFLGLLKSDWVKLERVINNHGVMNISYTPKDKK